MTRAALIAALLTLPLAALSGCSSPVGTYRIDSAEVLEAGCSGVESGRVAAWADSLNADPATDMQIGGKAGVVQAQLQRQDGTVLFADVTGGEDNVWAGTRELVGTTTSGALLGADFSALLETNGICEVDLTVEASLDFGEQGFDSVSGRFRVTLEETDTGTPCDIQSCSALIGLGAARTSSINPGVQAEDAAE